MQGRQLLSLSVSLKAHQSPSEKGLTLKGKTLLQRRAICFPFRVDPFSEGYKNKADKDAPLCNHFP